MIVRAIRAAAIAGLLIALGVALAQGASKTGVIKACAKKKSGALSLAKKGKCKKGQKKVSWNAKGPPGAPGSPGGPGKPGFSASASDSESPVLQVALDSGDTTLLSAHITTTAQSRIEASGGGTFAYSTIATSSSRLNCGLDITPQGGSAHALGQRVEQDFAHAGSGEVREPGEAGGAAVEPAGSYTVTLDCKQVGGSGTFTMPRGDLNVVAAAP